MSYKRITDLKQLIREDWPILQDMRTREAAVGKYSIQAMERCLNQHRQELIRRVKSLRPKVGQGATILHHTNRTACTITKVIETKVGKAVLVREDKCKLLNGPNSTEPDALKVHPGGFAANVQGVQRWACEYDPEGAEHKFSLRVNGAWIKVSQPTDSGQALLIGVHQHFYDYNF